MLAVSGGPDLHRVVVARGEMAQRAETGPKACCRDGRSWPAQNRGARRATSQSFAAALDVEHRTLRWRGPKPKTGLPAAAREARYKLLADAARKVGAAHILTAHTRDDQAETVLMRLARGSGLSGLAAMARETAREAPRGAVTIARPLLEVPKAQLIATLRRAQIGYADDPTNRDQTFTRARFRELMPQLMREGIDSRNLARLAQRLARANAALEAVVGVMDIPSAGSATGGVIEIDARAFATLPDEIALRLLGRAVGAVGREGIAELAKLEALLVGLRGASVRQERLKQTLAGAVIALGADLLAIQQAPPRRSSRVIKAQAMNERHAAARTADLTRPASIGGSTPSSPGWRWRSASSMRCRLPMTMRAAAELTRSACRCSGS